MGSEGYLINQFLVERTNQRSDAWGGSVENRQRFPVEIVRRLREAVGREFIVIYRLSMLDLVENGQSWDEIAMLAKKIEAAGATLINTGNRLARGAYSDDRDERAARRVHLGHASGSSAK